MLEPNDLRTLLDALRPPAGYQLDRAVGTSYSLDLYALVSAPLAFALFDSETNEDATINIAALLEAVRRHSDRIDVFCQAGQIALPAAYRPIVAYLEESVHEVAPRNRRRVFHPKVWALRFTAPDGQQAVFRLLVLSRNLTFDRSWDTMLLLEGAKRAGDAVRQRNAPLSQFIRELPRLAISPVERHRRSEIEALAEDLRQVEFELPAGFEELRFWPLGIPRASKWPFAQMPNGRRLVVSPFLSRPLLQRLGSNGVLVSRAESLDAIAADDLKAFGECHVLADAAVSSETTEDTRRPAVDETVAEAAGATLRGLHAKLFVFDAYPNSHVFTGSANATNAAFAGNVEFLVELVGKRSKCGVDAILAGTGGTGFSDLLEAYKAEAAEPTPGEGALIESRLEELRRAVATQPFTACVGPATEDDRHAAMLRAAGENSLVEGATARCWPITLGPSGSLPLSKVWDEGAQWTLSQEGVTAFFAVELTLREGRQSARIEFVVRAALDGAPADRLDRLLVSLLRTRGDVLRYMLFLLAGDDQAVASLRAFTQDVPPTGSGGDGQGGDIDLPLVEWMIRAISRSPDRVDHLARLIESLRATPGGLALLPPELSEVWDPIWSAREATR